MKNVKMIYLFIIVVTFLYTFSVGTMSANEKSNYKKYGEIAIAILKVDYPSENVVDYEYLGRLPQPEGDIAIDSFRFKVKEQNDDLFVVVKVAHHLKNNKVVHLSVVEELNN